MRSSFADGRKSAQQIPTLTEVNKKDKVAPMVITMGPADPGRSAP
jgi:hypothetical protein